MIPTHNEVIQTLLAILRSSAIGSPYTTTVSKTTTQRSSDNGTILSTDTTSTMRFLSEAIDLSLSMSSVRYPMPSYFENITDLQDLLILEESDTVHPLEGESFRQLRSYGPFEFLHFARYTPGDEYERVPGIFPGRPTHFTFDNDDGICPAPFRLSIGRLLKTSHEWAMFEVILDLSLGLGNSADATMEIPGLVVFPYKIVAQSDGEESLMEPVHGEGFNCVAWVEARKKSCATIKIHFHPSHPDTVVEEHDHLRGMEEGSIAMVPDLEP